MKRLLSFLLLLVSSATLAESGAYGVEVIVFRNLSVAAEAGGVDEFRSFSQFPGLEETRPAEDQIEDPADRITPELPGELPDDLPAAPRHDLPDDLLVITKKSAYMNDVWRRLVSSEDYQPLVYAAWQQNRTNYYPPMRVHNQQIIDTQLRPPTHIMLADLAAEDPLAAYRSTFYQLDGSVQLRRSRFLHLFLDLEYREENPPSGIGQDVFGENDYQTEIEAGIDIQTEIEPGTENNGGHRVFTLKHNV